MTPPQNMNLGVFKSGTLPAVVPGHARLEYNISYALAEAQAAKDAGLGWSAMLVRREFEAIVQSVAKADAWMAEHPPKVTWIKDLYPFETSLDEPIVQAAELAYQTVLRPEQRKPAGPDGGVVRRAHISVLAGIPVVGMGAGDDEDGPHQLRVRGDRGPGEPTPRRWRWRCMRLRPGPCNCSQPIRSWSCAIVRRMLSGCCSSSMSWRFIAASSSTSCIVALRCINMVFPVLKDAAARSREMKQLSLYRPVPGIGDDL